MTEGIIDQLDSCLVPWIRKQKYIEIAFTQFLDNTTYLSIVRKQLELHLNVLLFSNPGDKVQKSKKKTTGHIGSILSTRKWTLSPGLENNYTLKCSSKKFLTMLTNIVFLEKCCKYISTYGFCQVQGTMLYFLFKFKAAWILECDLYV